MYIWRCFLIKFKKIWITLIVAITLTITLLMPFSCSSESLNTFITEVHDGDTFYDNKENIYRLFGVDTPEANNQFDGFSNTSGIERIYSDQATKFAKNLIEGKEVKIEKVSVDKYSRIVAKIKVNGQDLAEELLAKGLARVAYFDVVNPKSLFYSTDYSYYEKLVWIQYQAFKSKLGVWEHPEIFKTIFPKALSSN